MIETTNADDEITKLRSEVAELTSFAADLLAALDRVQAHDQQAADRLIEPRLPTRAAAPRPRP
jgi:hypothetical protein